MAHLLGCRIAAKCRHSSAAMGVFFVMVERSSVNVMRILIGLTVAVGVSAVAIAKPTASLTSNFELEGLIRDPIKLHVESADGRRVMLDAFVTRPAGQGRWPVALLTHGTDGTFQQDKLELNPNRLSSAAITFARHGYAAVVVLRQGYGRSSRVTDYQGNSCATPRHHRAGKLARDDILIALRAIARQPWAAADKTILAGLSAGGFAVLAAGATNPAGVRAVINLDGGRGQPTRQMRQSAAKPNCLLLCNLMERQPKRLHCGFMQKTTSRSLPGWPEICLIAITTQGGG